MGPAAEPPLGAVGELETPAAFTICGTTREFDSLSQAIKEIIDARVSAGIHLRTADVQGYVMGKKISNYLDKRYFAPRV